MPYSDFYNREKVSRKEVRQYLQPYFFNKESNGIFWKSNIYLVGSKGLAVMSPYILKKVVDAMSVAGAVDYNAAAIGILIFGASRILGTIF